MCREGIEVCKPRVSRQLWVKRGGGGRGEGAGRKGRQEARSESARPQQRERGDDGWTPSIGKRRTTEALLPRGRMPIMLQLQRGRAEDSESENKKREKSSIVAGQNHSLGAGEGAGSDGVENGGLRGEEMRFSCWQAGSDVPSGSGSVVLGAWWPGLVEEGRSPGSGHWALGSLLRDPAGGTGPGQMGPLSRPYAACDWVFGLLDARARLGLGAGMPVVRSPILALLLCRPRFALPCPALALNWAATTFPSVNEPGLSAAQRGAWEIAQQARYQLNRSGTFAPLRRPAKRWRRRACWLSIKPGWKKSSVF